jgi:hypothetical protein
VHDHILQKFLIAVKFPYHGLERIDSRNSCLQQRICRSFSPKMIKNPLFCNQKTKIFGDRQKLSTVSIISAVSNLSTGWQGIEMESGGKVDEMDEIPWGNIPHLHV